MSTRKLTAALLLIASAVVAAAWWGDRSRAPSGSRAFSMSDARAPDSVRIRVEVLNASRVRGLGRRATMHLRDRGFDVVETATAEEQRESTLILDRSLHPEWAALVASAMGGSGGAQGGSGRLLAEGRALVESRPDSSRYVDVTVLVGASWRPPALPFYP